MTPDHAISLSLLPALSRIGLADRLRADDPHLIEQAEAGLTAARARRAAATRDGIHVVAWNEAHYPAALLTLPDFPPALWFRGALDTLDRPAVAIVGSRAATPVALETATRLAEGLARRGIVVVSGLARGVDSAAHRGALEAGRTVAVLGSGPDVIYPHEHRALARRIVECGVVISEYPPGTPPAPFHFPQRNRVISGASLAVVVVEAAAGSGSLITASCALEQGRDVMAVPGNVLSGRNRGAHALIRDGAKIVESADDILEGLGLDPSGDADGRSTATGSQTTGSADPVLRAMTPGQPYDLDALSGACGLDSARLLPRLMDFELRQLVRRVGGGRFMRPA